MPDCTSHPRTEAVGYCSICGCFGCGRCLNLGVDRKWYCLPCARKNKVALADRSDDPHPEKAVHLQLVACYRDGRTLKGTSYNLDPSRDTFYMVSLSGERVLVKFSDLKYVKAVSDFSPSSMTPRAARRLPKNIRGQEIEIHFVDGEILKAHFKGQYRPDAPRFRVTPAAGSDQISILVERSATTDVRVGDHLAQQNLSDLISDPVRQSLLKFYRQNSSLITPVETLAQRLRIRPAQLEVALKPFYLLKLIRKINMGNGEHLEFLPPPTRKVHAFLREHAPKIKK